MTEDQIATFKPAGFCWKPNPNLSSICIRPEGHPNQCGWSTIMDECEHVGCTKFNCSAEARDTHGDWRKLCREHIEPYTRMSAGRIPDEDLKVWI